jgi:threonine dehydrogenase-like Zn-dependent dehydrogenase
VASSAADDWQPVGHEVSGVVHAAGGKVSNAKVGDNVVLESGTFDRFAPESRNGRVDLNNKGPNFWLTGPMGFADYIIVPREVCVPFEGIAFEEASMIEPLGVALDMFYTADISMGDDVLVVGLGPIGLMALRLAKSAGARKVYGAELSQCAKRIEVAKLYGADDVILSDKQKIEEYAFENGGVNKVMLSAPPKVIPSALKTMRVGGIMSFIGIEYGPKGEVTFDANDFHFKKHQLRASMASPALYFPRCIELVKAGTIDLKPLIGDRFALADIKPAMERLRDDKANSLKSVMVN